MLERFLLNTTHSITIIIFSSLLIFITSLCALNVSAAGEDLNTRIEHKEQELSGVKTRIEILERYLKFENAWDKKLKKGLKKIKKIQSADSKIAKGLRLLASAISKGASEKFIANKIAAVNSAIEPYFRVDKKGNLHFGAALQMAGVQTQFAPSGMTALTPETAKEILKEWRANNKDHITNNSAELKVLQEKEKTLLGDLQTLEKEKRAQEGSEGISSPEQNELNALKGKLGSLEKLIENRVKIATQYNDKEFEMQLHIAVAQKTQNEALAQYGKAMHTLGMFWWEFSSTEEVTKSISGVRETDSRLRKANTAYNDAADDSSDAADTVCAYASGLDTDPPPTPEDVSRWSRESKTLLDNTVRTLSKKREKALLLKDSLTSSVSGLKSQLLPLERVLSNRETFLDVYVQVGEVKKKLEGVKKDFEKAKELEGDLKALILTSTLAPWEALSKDLGAIKKDATALSGKVGDNTRLNRELAGINKRIETAERRLGPTQIPDTPPTASKMSSRAKKLLSELSKRDLSKAGEKNIKEAESIVADGNKAVSEAEKTLTLALDEKEAEANLKRARQCYTTLTGAEHQVGPVDPLEGKVGALETRLDKAEREFDSLMEFNTEINGLIEKMKEHVARAEMFKGLKDAIATEVQNSYEPAKADGKFKEVNELITLIESHISKLKKAYIMLDRASKQAAQMREQICAYVEKAGSAPYPSGEDLELWKQESKDRIIEVGVALKVAAAEVDAQTGEIASKTPGLKSKMELLEKSRSVLLTDMKFIADRKTFNTDIDKEIAAAKKLKQSIDDKYKEFGKRLKVLSKEIDDINSKAKSYLPLAKSEPLKLRISGLINRNETMSKRFNKMPMLKIPDIPQSEKDNKFVGPDAMIKFLVNKLAEIDSLLSRGKQALSDADAVSSMGTAMQAIQQAPEAFKEADACHTSLIESASEEYYIVRVSGKGFIPHFSHGSFIKEGFKDIKVGVSPEDGVTIESAIDRIREKWSGPPNCERNIIDRLALSQGPPRFWDGAPEVTKKAGPLTSQEMEKQSFEEEWKLLGNDGPPFCELLERFCGGQTCAGSDDEDVGQTSDGEPVAPVNPDALDPDTDPKAVRMIQEWLSIAEPPENAVPGNRFYYDRFGRKMGSGGGMRTIGAHDSVDYGEGVTPESKVWTALRKDLDSVNHCTLEEYVVTRLEGRSTANCRGRYTSLKPLKGKKLKEAQGEVTKKGLKYEVSTGSAAESKESEGAVEKQDPGPDNHLKRGQTLMLIVYDTYVPPMVAVPSITNMKFDDAVAKLQSEDFKFERADIQNTLSEDKNLIVKTQEPAADKEAEKGSTVKLEVYGSYSYFNDAITALEACNSEKVKEYIAKMPSGEEKAQIERKNKELGQHVSETARGKDEAEKQFETDCFNNAATTLNELLDNARCADERETVTGLIAEYEDKSSTKRQEMKAMTDKAMQKYDEQCFDESLDVLGTAIKSTRCEESRRTISKLTEKVKTDQKKKEAAIGSMTGEAMTHFEKGCYSDALQIMNKVVNDIRCESSRTEPEKLISKIETKRASVSKRMKTALQNLEQGCFEDAKTVLSSLQEEIKCGKYMGMIDKLDKRVEAKRAGFNTKMKEALNSFKRGCYDQAQSVLEDLKTEVKCEKTLTKINGFLAKCTNRKQSLRSDINSAINKYEAGNYRGAKTSLRGMLDEPLCKTTREEIEGLIAGMEPTQRSSPLMPDLKNMKVDEAARTVRNLGMKPSVRKDKKPTQKSEALRVYAQKPAKNKPARPGAAVEIYAYSEFVAVPVPVPTPTDPVIQSRNEPFYIAFRMYFPDVTPKSEYTGGGDYEQYLSTLNTSNITYKPNNDAPLIMHVSGDALGVYSKNAFVPGKKYSQEIRMTVLSEEIKQVLNKNTIDGAFLLEVSGVYGGENELKGTYPKAGTQEKPVMQISNAQGTYTYYQEGEMGSGKIWGGRLVEGWPERMKQKNLELVQILFNFCFIATVVYQDWDAPELDTLRLYRDSVLARSEAGKRVIRAYYKYGPQLALKVYKYERIRPLLRLLLDGGVSVVRNSTEDPSSRYAVLALSAAVHLMDNVAALLDEDDVAAAIESEFIFFKWLPAAESPEK